MVAVLATLMGAVLCSLWVALRPVQRSEVEQFARSAHLVLTESNGPRVLDAIARTRFWRVVGISIAFAALVASAAAEWSDTHTWTVSLLWLLGLLGGAYAGGVIAEFRTAYRADAPGPRTASLRRRQARDYVERWATRWPAVIGVAGLAAAGYGFAVDRTRWWLPAAGALAAVLAVVTALITRYVVERPQALESPDLAAAEDAVRSRSLHVLAGSTVGIQLWLVSLALSAPLLNKRTDSVDEVVLVMFGVVVPLVSTVVGRRLGQRDFAPRDGATESPRDGATESPRDGATTSAL